MTGLDWTVIVVVLGGIILYGLYRSRTTPDLEGYFLSNRSMPWYLVLLSIMGTQASAITFLSGPGQAYADGMRFVQYYFGLPLAMVVICITFVPLFNRQRVLTAYEFLERRFDGKTRLLTTFLFLLQRALSTGISIYAPAIILSSLFGWDIFWTNVVMGGLLIIYTVAGGARAVAYTQQLQLIIIFSAMFLAGYFVVKALPEGVGFTDALQVGGRLGRVNIITDGVKEGGGFDWNDRYNIWSGIIGGFFLSLSYFGTDQSQVGRYLTAQNNTESRLGLLLNGIVKVPMQFFILLLGVLVFAFYQFRPAPISFNSTLVSQTAASEKGDSLRVMQHSFDSLQGLRAGAVNRFITDGGPTDSLRNWQRQSDSLRTAFRGLSSRAGASDTNDNNYVFLGFVRDHLPAGLKGLLIAIIFLAAWGSIAAALNSLAASTVVDLHRRKSDQPSDAGSVRLSRWYTFGWGIFCIGVAQFADNLGQSLIEAVNVLGSLFYGVILGIFLVAFYARRVGGSAIFWSAVVMELFIVVLFFNERLGPFSVLPDVSFLWLNAIGALGVFLLALLVEGIRPSRPGAEQP